METISFILNEFKAFLPQTKVADVKSFFNETTFCHFPVVQNGQLIGLISETDIQGITEDDKEIGDFKYLFQVFYAEKNNNLLELFKVFADNETNLIPVINEKKQYIGYYDLIDILHLYNGTPYLNSEGTIILIEKEVRDYSFSEICQIVESNNGKVLGLFISEANPTSVKITLKFNSPDVNEIIQSFRRYNYQILSKHKEDFYIEDLKERSEYLQKYLNI
jgi:predicted transcriptional regulator